MTVEDLYQRGFEFRCEGKYQEAKLEFEAALVIDGAHSDSKWQLGLIKGFEGDFEGSLEMLQAVVDQFPDHVKARYDLAMTMMMLGMSDEACEQFREVLKYNPNHEETLRQIVYCP